MVYLIFLGSATIKWKHEGVEDYSMLHFLEEKNKIMNIYGYSLLFF